MNRTTEQITYIDDYLKHHKVKYWDIRIELLDHIVTNVEALMDKGISFDDAMIEVHKSFGNSMKMFWNSRIEYGIFANGLGYKSLIEDKRIEINNKYRKLYWKEVGAFFNSFKKSSIFFSLLFIEYVLYNQLVLSVFKKINLILFISPVVLFYIYTFINNYAMKKRSINMQNAVQQTTISFLILQGTIHFIKPDSIFNFSTQTQMILLSIVVALNLTLTFCGFEVYRKSEKFYSDVYNKLQSL